MLQIQLKFYHRPNSGSSNSESQFLVLTFQVQVDQVLNLQVQVQVLKLRVQVQLVLKKAGLQSRSPGPESYNSGCALADVAYFYCAQLNV